MKRGEGMAPLTEDQLGAVVRRETAPRNTPLIGKRDGRTPVMNTLGEKHKRSSQDSSDIKNNRAVPGGSPGLSGSDKSSGAVPDAGKGKSTGSDAKGLKSTGNGGNSNDDKNKGNNNNNNSNSGKSSGNNNNNNNNNSGSNGNSNNNGNSNSKSGGSNSNGNGNGNSNSGSNSGKTGNGNSNNNGNNGNSNSGTINSNNNNNGSGNRNGSGSSATTATAATGNDAGSSDSNGAQRFSSESDDTTTTSTNTPTAAAPTTVVLTTSTVVTTGPDAVVTSFVPLIAPTTTSNETASPKTRAGLEPFGTNFPGFPGFAKPTSSGKDSTDDKKHKGAEKGNSTMTNDNNKGNNNSKNGSKNSAKALDPTAERALISVGSIGAFIVMCFVFWLVWRAMRKQKRKKMAQGDGPSFQTNDRPLACISRLPGRVYARIVGKIPFLNRRRQAWKTLEDETTTPSAKQMSANGLGPSPVSSSGPDMYDDKDNASLRTFGFDSDLPPRVPSKAYYPSGLGLQFLRQSEQFGAHGPAKSPSSPQASAPLGTQAAVPYGGSGDARGVMGQPVSSVMNAGDEKIPASEASTVTGTMRSRMPDPFYNQSQLARQPSDAYDPARRQVNRTSELSSLSSGFGDGEMLALGASQQQGLSKTQPPAHPLPQPFPPPPPIPSGRTPNMGGAGRFSWMRNKRISRETVYTESSEDQPAKFRSVSSWVNQQTGRVRRAQASIDITKNAAASTGADGSSGVVLMPGNEPGIPHPLPEEQRLTMMMDEEEVPRRPETVPGIPPS